MSSVSPSWSRCMASWAISASSRSSFMNRLDIISWSWRRCPGDMLSRSDCSWAARRPSCSSSSSRLSTPGKFWPHFALNASKSGSSPSARWRSMWLRSRIISRMRLVLGAHALERLLHALHERLEHLLLERFHELLEEPLRFGVGKVVVLELLDPPRRIRRELVESLELLRALTLVLDLAVD